MPVFDERGLVPQQPSQPPSSMVTVSSGNLSREEGNKDSEATLAGARETSPLRQSDLLRSLYADDDADEHPVRESPRPAGVTMRSGGM